MGKIVVRSVRDLEGIVEKRKNLSYGYVLDLGAKTLRFYEVLKGRDDGALRDAVRAFVERYRKETEKLPTPLNISTSFEGVINNGAVECFFSMVWGMRDEFKDRGEVFKALGDWLSKYEDVNAFLKDAWHIVNYFKGSPLNKEVEKRVGKDVLLILDAFLALRPGVSLAYDYATVLITLDNIGLERTRALGEAYRKYREGGDWAEYKEVVHPFIEEYGKVDAAISDEKKEEWKKKFYEGRKAMKEADKELWKQLNLPIEGHFNAILSLQSMAIKTEDLSYIPFVFHIMSSKDKESILQLCAVHTQNFKKGAVVKPFLNVDPEKAAEKMQSGECFAPNIMGVEVIEKWGAALGLDKKKVKKYKNPLQILSLYGEIGDENGRKVLYLPETLEERAAPVVRWDDRLDEDLSLSLAMVAGVQTLLTPFGYAYPWEKEAARGKYAPIFVPTTSEDLKALTIAQWMAKNFIEGIENAL